MSAGLRGPLRTVFMRRMYLVSVSFSPSPPGFPGSLESDMAEQACVCDRAGESGRGRRSWTAEQTGRAGVVVLLYYYYRSESQRPTQNTPPPSPPLEAVQQTANEGIERGSNAGRAERRERPEAVVLGWRRQDTQ